ncbi:MAG: LysR family transcriptional regulator, partial [Oligoflexia bacterium]|nr:LysR family transcriptional regulator [Oligoflexia bacterium]
MIMKNINWNWIYYFYEVARYSSMTEASKVIGISLPTISEQISRLEKELNVKLFQRSVRKLDLTSEGQSLYAIVKKMFQYGPDILKSLSPDFIGGNPIKIGIQEGIVAEYSLELIFQYWDNYIPYGIVNVEKTSTLEDMARSIVKGNFEWGLTCEIPQSDNIDTKKVGSEEVQFCCSEKIYHAFKDKKDILKYIPFIKNSKDSLLNEKILDHFSRIHCIPNEVIEIDQRELSLNLIQKDRCVSVFTKQTLDHLSADMGIKGFTIERPIFLDFYILWCKGREKALPVRKILESCASHVINLNRSDHKYHDSYLQLKVIDIPKEA